jgi:uncharacterized membrane protein
MPHEQTASWLGLLDLYNELSEGWTLIGGQLVHLYCAERGETAMRPTNDADMVIDIRASPTMLRTFTQTLSDLGFTSAGISAEGRQHRWIRDAASFDVLIPEGTGDRASARGGFTGSPTVSSEGGTQALLRSESVAVSVEGREGFVRRPNMVGSLVMKAGAHSNAGDRDPRRHRWDFVTLASLVTAGDFSGEKLSPKDRQRLRRTIAAVRNDRQLMVEITGGAEALERLEIASGLVD